jgi:hypothetical protein
MDIQLNIEPTAPSDLVAFSDLYEDQLRTLQLASEQDTIDRAWHEYMSEKDKDQPKYARIARVYVPLLRQIFTVSRRSRDPGRASGPDPAAKQPG